MRFDLCLKGTCVNGAFQYLCLSLSFLEKKLSSSSFVQWAVNGVYGIKFRPLDSISSSSSESWYEERLTTDIVV